MKNYDRIKTIQDLFNVGMDRELPRFLEDNLFGVALNFGAGNKNIEGAIPLDYPDYDFDISHTTEYDNESIQLIHAYHFLEHLRDPVGMLLEFQRILKIGGHVNIVVPYYSAQIACQDLDHKKFFTEETWKTLFQNPYYNKNKVEWKFHIKTNIIIGIVERNLCLMTQLVKTQ